MGEYPPTGKLGEYPAVGDEFQGGEYGTFGEFKGEHATVCSYEYPLLLRYELGGYGVEEGEGPNGDPPSDPPNGVPPGTLDKLRP